jgi:hypothetical protein
LRLVRRVPSLILLVTFAASLHAQTAVPASLRDFLEQHAGFEKSDIRDLAEGRPVAKVAETKSGDEVAVAGAVRVGVPRDFFLRQFIDIVGFKRQQSIHAVGKFEKPPTLGDLDGLQLHPKSMDALRDCRAGHCQLKLSAKDILRFQQEIAWSQPGAAESANGLFRGILLQRLLSYLESGNRGLADYNDKKSPVSLARESSRLVSESAYLQEFAPRLADCLKLFPDCDSGIETFHYWSKENYGHGLKSVVSMTQVLIDRQKVGDSEWIWEASKQLYADHYSDSSLGVMLMVEASPENGNPSFYLIYLNRTHFDSLRGFWAFVIRGIIRGKARGELSDQLELIRTRMQNVWMADATPAEKRSGRSAGNEEH